MCRSLKVYNYLHVLEAHQMKQRLRGKKKKKPPYKAYTLLGEGAFSVSTGGPLQYLPHSILGSVAFLIVLASLNSICVLHSFHVCDLDGF